MQTNFILTLLQSAGQGLPQEMNPTLTYNGCHLQRKKIYQDNPRSNLVSTIDFTWRQSVDRKRTPRQQIQYKRGLQTEELRRRSNDLISKRLKKQVNLQPEVFYKRVQVQFSKQIGRQSPLKMDRRHSLRDALYQQVHNYDQLRKRQLFRIKNHDQDHNRNYKYTNNNNYMSALDPQLQSLTSTKSLAESQLIEMTKKNSYLGEYLNRRLQKYLSKDNTTQRFYDTTNSK